jgi:hypothetical protein
MTDNEAFLTASLQHGNLHVDASDPNPRPMIAVLDARPGLTDTFRKRIVELVRQVRREPGCVTFTAYEAATRRGASTCTRSTPTPPHSTPTSRPAMCTSSSG